MAEEKKEQPINYSDEDLKKFEGAEEYARKIDKDVIKDALEEINQNIGRALEPLFSKIDATSNQKAVNAMNKFKKNRFDFLKELSKIFDVKARFSEE